MSLEPRQRRRFDERVMVITGAGQGIGRRVAECAARETGHHEVVWYFSKLCIEDWGQMGMRNFLAD